MKKTWKYTKKFAEDMYKSLGVRLLFFVAMETPAGSVNTGIMDFNDGLGGGASYAAKHSNWKIEGIDLDSWNDHNRNYYNSDKTSADISAVKVPRSLPHLDRNEFGEPILPNPLFVPSRQSGRIWRQGLVRAFMTYHYCKSYPLKIRRSVDSGLIALASGSERAIPWKKLLPQLRDCVEEEYLPEALLPLVGEPSTMKDDHCHSILTFWYTRQTDGMAPTFRFKNYLVKDQLMEALPREKVDDTLTENSVIPSGPQLDANAHGNGRRARRKAKSGITPGPRIPHNDESRVNSPTPIRTPKARTLVVKNKGKGKARDTEMEISSQESTSSSDAEQTTTATENTSGETTDSDLDDTSSDGGSGTSRGTIPDLIPTFQRGTQGPPNPKRRLSIRSPATTNHSLINVDHPSQVDGDSGNEDLVSSESPELAPELIAIAQMVQQGIDSQEINARVLQAFGSMRVKSRSQSPLKPGSRVRSPVTDLGKRRGRSSIESLPPASPSKKSRLGRLVNRPPETSPDSLAANLSHPSSSAQTGFQSPPVTEQQAIGVLTTLISHNVQASESASIAPEASTSTALKSRGTGCQSLPRKKQPKSSSRVTRSNSPKKRSTRAHPI